MTKTKTAALTVALLLPAIAFRAFVITRLWLWFVTPFGVMPLTISHSLGLVLLVAVVRPRHEKAEENPTLVAGVPKSLVESIGLSVLSLLVGWALTGTMP